MKWTYAECFAGIGAWGKAIERVSKKHNDTCELQYYYEIDAKASNAFAAIHNVDECLNKWDIMEDPEELPEVDVFFYSPPCQTFSIAGKREGTNVEKGNLFYHAIQKLEKSNPKFAIMENVKGLPSGDTYNDFINMLWLLDEKGYVNYWAVLNSKDFGIPQSRERVFVISIRKDIYESGIRFEFPKTIPLEKNMMDILENEVDSKYFLLQKMIDALIFKEDKKTGSWDKVKPKNETNNIANCLETKEGYRKTNNFIEVKNFDIQHVGNVEIKGLMNAEKRVYLTNGICPTLITKPIIKIISANKRGYEELNPGDTVNFAFPNGTTRRGRVGKQISPTIATSCTIGYFNGSLIRRLTPLECFRLQGFDDEDYFKAVKNYDDTYGTKKDGSTKSDAQMYMRAGNSITVNVIEEILENLLYQRKQDEQQLSLF